MPQKPVKTSASGVGKRPQSTTISSVAVKVLRNCSESLSRALQITSWATQRSYPEEILILSDAYNAPELMAWYCSSECLIGKSLEMPSPEIASVERTTMKLLKQLRQGDIEQVKEKLIDITADGIISKDEWADLTEILDYLDGLIRAARELKLIGSKLLNGGADDG